MQRRVDPPPDWELETFWDAVEREVAAPDPADLEAFRAAGEAAPDLEPRRAARLRTLIRGAVAQPDRASEDE